MRTEKKELALATGAEKIIKPAKFAFEGDVLQKASKEDPQKWIASLYATFGTTDIDVLNLFVDQIQNVSGFGPSGEDHAKALNSTLPLLLAIRPENEVETMLAAQMVGIHAMTMSMMRRAMLPDQTVEGVSNNVNRVTKLSRTFISLLEALNKHRGKGKQKITVEHVTVNEGGQAVVGNVEYGGKDEKEK
jgi:hypothetical protein